MRHFQTITFNSVNHNHPHCTSSPPTHIPTLYSHYTATYTIYPHIHQLFTYLTSHIFTLHTFYPPFTHIYIYPLSNPLPAHISTLHTYAYPLPIPTFTLYTHTSMYLPDFPPSCLAMSLLDWSLEVRGCKISLSLGSLCCWFRKLWKSFRVS